MKKHLKQIERNRLLEFGYKIFGYDIPLSMGNGKIMLLFFLYDSFFVAFGEAYRKFGGIKNCDSRESQILFTKKNYQHHDKK